MGRTKASALPGENVNAKAVLLLLLLACLWGGNAVALKIALRDMEPFMIAGLRFALAATVIGLWGIFNKISLRPRPGEIPHLLLLSLIFAAQISTFNLGAKFTLAGRTSIFINTHPFFTTILAHFSVSNDRLSIRKALGLILAFLGVLTIFREKVGIDGSRVIGDGLVIASGFLLGAINVYTKILVQRINKYKLLLWEMIFGLVPFFGLSLIFERSSPPTVSPSLILSLLYQGAVIGGFGFVCWTALLKRYSASKVSAFMFATPLFGVGLSSIILKENVTPYIVVGAVLVAGGIYVVNKSRTGARAGS